MLDILARAAFEAFSTPLTQGVGNAYGSLPPLTWERLPPHAQALWRDVARSVIKEWATTSYFSPSARNALLQQITHPMTTQRPVNTKVVNSPRQPSHTPPKNGLEPGPVKSPKQLPSGQGAKST